MEQHNPAFEKIPLTVTNPFSENLRRLQALFPSIVKDGQVDLEALKAELGEFEEVDKEHYELSWAGKQEAKRTAGEPILGRTLKYVPEESKHPDSTENLYIEGDNLEVLKLLQNAYIGKIKMIYIDPPYNTGNDFVYRDHFAVTAEENAKAEGDVSAEGERYAVNPKTSGKYHANWLSMMYPRLRLAKNLLRDDGVIFISIGQDEINNLISCCDEIYGEENKVSIISRVMKSGGAKGNYFSPNVEYILVYGKNITSLEYFRDQISEEIIKKLYTSIEKVGPRKGERYRPFGLYQSSLDARPNQRYYIQCPDGTYAIPPGITMPSKVADAEKVFPKSGDGCWRWSVERYLDEKEKGNIVFIESPSGVLITSEGSPSKWNVYTKIWLSDRQEEGTVPVNLINKWENRQSAKELTSLKIPFDFAKPFELIKYLLSLVQNTKNEYVMDFFSGSATTAHAVMQLNAEDGGNRKFIMVQLPEVCDEKSEAYKAGYKTICEIGKERIRRAGDKILSEHPDAKVDTGFNVFRLADTNIRWIAAETGQVSLEDALITSGKDLRDFMPGYTDKDVVYEILLRQYDIPLTAKIESLGEIGKRTYSVARALIVCLEESITNEIIDKIAAIEPVPHKIIFRDSAFADDITLKENTMMRLDALMQKHSSGGKTPYRVEFL